MRLRNVKDKENVLENAKNYIDNPERLCGKCHFIKQMARKYPDINFVAIERNRSVLALGLKNEIEDNDLPNLRFINYNAALIDKIFNREVKTIYLNFSDPWPKSRHCKRRLTHEVFLKKYDVVFKDERKIIQKTDNLEFFAFSIESLSKYGYVLENVIVDLQKIENNDNIETEYEVKFKKKGCKIYKLLAIKK